MNRKTTILSLKCLFVLAFTQVLNAQQIYTNGPISTGTPSSNATAAPAGYTWSELQTPNTTLGAGVIYNNAATADLSLADDFVVPAGEVWNLTSADFFVYQTGFTGTTVPPIDILRVRIWNGDPSSGTATVVFGDMTTNAFNVANSDNAFVYRTALTTGTTRRVWRVNANITASLPAGTYWIEYQVHATNDLNIFAPPVTILNTLTDPTWNGKQRTVAAWANLADGGSFNQLAVPFVLNGTLSSNENAFEASISLSPNPVRDMLSISVATGTSVTSYEIFDVNGKVVKALNGTSSISEINVSELSVGNYILRLQSDKGIASKKFIKE